MTQRLALWIVWTVFVLINGFFAGVAAERVRFEAQRQQRVAALDEAVARQHQILMELENQAACSPHKRGRWAWRGCPQHESLR